MDSEPKLQGKRYKGGDGPHIFLSRFQTEITLIIYSKKIREANCILLML
jgi:hypothetical protein